VLDVISECEEKHAATKSKWLMFKRILHSLREAPVQASKGAPALLHSPSHRGLSVEETETSPPPVSKLLRSQTTPPPLSSTPSAKGGRGMAVQEADLEVSLQVPLEEAAHSNGRTHQLHGDDLSSRQLRRLSSVLLGTGRDYSTESSSSSSSSSSSAVEGRSLDRGRSSGRHSVRLGFGPQPHRDLGEAETAAVRGIGAAPDAPRSESAHSPFPALARQLIAMVGEGSPSAEGESEAERERKAGTSLTGDLSRRSRKEKEEEEESPRLHRRLSSSGAAPQDHFAQFLSSLLCDQRVSASQQRETWSLLSRLSARVPPHSRVPLPVRLVSLRPRRGNPSHGNPVEVKGAEAIHLAKSLVAKLRTEADSSSSSSSSGKVEEKSSALFFDPFAAKRARQREELCLQSTEVLWPVGAEYFLAAVFENPLSVPVHLSSVQPVVDAESCCIRLLPIPVTVPAKTARWEVDLAVRLYPHPNPNPGDGSLKVRGLSLRLHNAECFLPVNSDGLGCQSGYPLLPPLPSPHLTLT
jgi:hypothetical protein